MGDSESESVNKIEKLEYIAIFGFDGNYINRLLTRGLIHL